MGGKVINQFWAVLGQPAAHPSFRAAAETAQRLAEENPGRTFFVMGLQDAYCASVEVSSLPIECPLTTEYPLPDAGPQAEDDGWIKWDGGQRPVPCGRHVATRYRDGSSGSSGRADLYRWDHWGTEADIVAYKALTP
jgi:hypothetical protein